MEMILRTKLLIRIDQQVFGEVQRCRLRRD
ncbi:hypothetical protein WHR41_09613 [Cladosporium halotolerans]|uniref:Uncharacterized protein n=1 Tax=Cladosporium halotolerans TaxID=1052096 RepID=A0AB34KDC7_9PEZI